MSPMWILLGGTALVAVVFLGLGLLNVIGSLFPAKATSGTATTTPTPAAAPATSGTATATVEVIAGTQVPATTKSIWHLFGFVDNTPGMIWAVVDGPNEKSGPIEEYISSSRENRYDPVKKMTPRGNVDQYAGEHWIEHLIRTYLGLRRFGKPLVNKLRPLTIDRVVRKKTIAGGPVLKLKDQLESVTVTRYGLKERITRPTYHDSFDAKGGGRFSIISDSIIDVVNPEPIFEQYADSFLEDYSSRLHSYLASVINNLTTDEYKESQRKGSKEFSLDDLNARIAFLGLKVRSLTLSDLEIHPDIQARMQVVAEAEEQGKAAVKTAESAVKVAEQTKKAAIIGSEGDAQAMKNMAEAEASRIEALTKVFQASDGVDRKTALDRASAFLQAQMRAEAISKNTGTFVEGGAGVQPVLPIGGGKK